MTERLRTEQHLLELAAVVEQSAAIVCVTDAEGAIEYVNPAFERATGYRSGEVIGENPRILRSGAHGPELYEALWRTIKAGQPFGATFQNRRKNGEVFFEEKTITPLRASSGEITRFVATGKDVTERIRAEERLQRVLRARHMVSECNRVMVRSASEEELLPRMCRVLVEEGGYRMAWVGLAQSDAAHSVRPIAWFGHEAEYLKDATITWADDERGRGPTGTAIRTGTTQSSQDLAAAPTMAPWREAALARGYLASIALPLRNASGVFGALTIYADTRGTFGEEEIGLLEEFAADVAYSYEALRARRLREQAERAAQAAQRTLQEAVASIAEGFVLFDREDRLVLCNQPYLDIYAESADLLVPGNRFEQIIRRRAERGQYKDAVGRVDAWVAARMERHRAADGAAIEQELADGKWVMVLERRTPSGYIAGSRIDITALKRTERALRESESRFRMLAELSSDYITELDESFRYTSVGVESADKFALRQPGFLGKIPWEIPGSNLTEARLAEFRAMHERHETFREFEYSRLSADGKRRWISASGAPFFDENGRFKGYRGVGRDITERKNVENELRRFRLAMDTSVDSIYLTDPESMRFVDVNEEACKRLGYSREELLKKRSQDVLDTDAHELKRAYDEAIAAGGQGTVVGVGMTITDHPLHRSGRADFPHPALASGDDAEAA